MVQNVCFLPESGSVTRHGLPEEMLRFSLRHQLLNRETWKSFVNVFRTDCDDADTGWRCEYWGKMMRGAVLTWRACGDAELYAVLEQTVRDLLTAQRADGRFSTYSAAAQLNGWDLWGRKYVLTGMLHFYEICQDGELKKRILDAMLLHARAIADSVGIGEGKKPITETSAWWGCVNSCSILEPIVELYKRTGEEKLRAFAEYILSVGGCRDGDLIELALRGEKMPFEYPEVKAYETMSFFEGVLAWYELTGEEKYLRAVLNFVQAVERTDITEIGCSGCTHELFDHSSLRQTEYSETIMQETCVTVTWMRLMFRLHLLTGGAEYLTRLERSGWNALYGAVNTRLEEQLSMEQGVWLSALPFDSYSPLYRNRRGRGIGGFKTLPDGGYYGCCACIASAGTALLPLAAVLCRVDGIEVNLPLDGAFRVKTPAGRSLTGSVASRYPLSPEYVLTLQTEETEQFSLYLRVPEDCRGAYAEADGVRAEEKDGYLVLRRVWKNGDKVTFRGDFALEREELNGKYAFRLGPVVLARDEEKERETENFDAPLAQSADAERWQLLPAQAGELVRLELDRGNGERLLLTDYASCGKRWRGKRNRVSVWLDA